METKRDRENAWQDTIERYVYQVTRRLPGKQRADIERELRGLVEDMLDTRCGERAPDKEDVEAVLTQLGAPAAFAAQYGAADGKPRYLIGPAIFFQYLTVLQIVLFAVAIGMTVVTCIEAFVGADGATGFALLGAWLSNMLSAMFSAAAAVTLLFAIFEWRGVKVDALDGDWLDQLPPVPARENRFSRGECIFGIAASSVLLLLFVTAPRYLAVFAEGNAIPIFNMELYPRLLPLIVAVCALGVCKEAAKLIEGRYTMRLAVGLTVANVVSIVLTVIVLTQPVWNRSLIVLLDEAAPLDNVDFLQRFWDAFGQAFLGVLLIGFVADLISLWVHTLRAVRE